MTVRVQLTKGYDTLVDRDQCWILIQYRWCYGNGYAWTTINGRKVGMHRVLTGAPDDMDVDHINGDPLDNRMSNLRIVTRSQNNANQRPRAGTSKYKGVAFCRDTEKWRAYITKDGKRKHLGRFKTPEEAAEVYNLAALERFGEFACLNKIDKTGRMAGGEVA